MQARRVKKRTSLRSSRPVKFTISYKQQHPRNALNGSKPSRWPPELESEGTPAAPYHPPKEAPQICVVRDLFTSGNHQWDIPSAGALTITNPMLCDIHVY